MAYRGIPTLVCLCHAAAWFVPPAKVYLLPRYGPHSDTRAP